jgi:hypothetical protein
MRHGIERLVHIGRPYDYLLCLAHALQPFNERQTEPFGGLVHKHKEAVVRANSYCGGQRPPYIIRYYNLLFSHNLSKKTALVERNDTRFNCSDAAYHLQRYIFYVIKITKRPAKGFKNEQIVTFLHRPFH